jgi:hypothetical protein
MWLVFLYWDSCLRENIPIYARWPISLDRQLDGTILKIYCINKFCKRNILNLSKTAFEPKYGTLRLSAVEAVHGQQCTTKTTSVHLYNHGSKMTRTTRNLTGERCPPESSMFFQQERRLSTWRRLSTYIGSTGDGIRPSDCQSFPFLLGVNRQHILCCTECHIHLKNVNEGEDVSPVDGLWNRWNTGAPRVLVCRILQIFRPRRKRLYANIIGALRESKSMSATSTFDTVEGGGTSMHMEPTDL